MKAASTAVVVLATLTSALIEVPLQRRLIKKPEPIPPSVVSLVEVSQSPDNELTAPANYFSHSIGNYQNVQYFGKLAIGSNQEEHEFIFDTGSPWLWIANENCISCHTSKLYNTRLSTTYEQLRERKELRYETGSAAGYVAIEKVCLDVAVCIDDMIFISVDDTDDMALRYNGVLGLSPGSQLLQLPGTKQATNSFIEQLYQKDLI